MDTGPRGGSADAILTIPNALSFARILLIPVFVTLIVHRGTEMAGLLLFGGVSATDWVDGFVARRTGQVSELGKLLDPTADRLAITAGLIAMVVRGAFPLWAALLIFLRDGLILVVGAVALAVRGARIEVRFIGKLATFTLLAGVPLVAWGNLDLPLRSAAIGLGWMFTVVGIVEYYAAAALYAFDLRRAFAGQGERRA